MYIEKLCDSPEPFLKHSGLLQIVLAQLENLELKSLRNDFKGCRFGRHLHVENSACTKVVDTSFFVFAPLVGWLFLQAMTYVITEGCTKCICYRLVSAFLVRRTL